MSAIVRKFSHPDLRERLTYSILDTLDNLPESHRQIFVWKHYRGWKVDRIAASLKCSKSDVETILSHIHASLFRKTGALLT